MAISERANSIESDEENSENEEDPEMRRLR